MSLPWASLEYRDLASLEQHESEAHAHRMRTARQVLDEELERGTAEPGWRSRLQPLDALRSVLDHYDDFTGRASRRELWWWAAALGVGLALLALVGEQLPLIAQTAGLVAVVVVAVPTLAVIVRRIHDAGHSAVWLATVLIPGIGLWILGALLLVESEEHPNRFGAPPPGSAYADPSTWLATDGAAAG